MEQLSIYGKLSKIQTELKAPKGQTNAFGKYKYRSCEDIMEALKPHLAENNLAIILSDELVNIGDRYYIKASATLTNGKEEIINTAYAREEESKKGMDSSQVTGASASYARKYALNGLLAIDDTKDSDTTNTHGKATPQTPQEATEASVTKDNPLANEFIGEDEINALQGEFKRTGIHEPVILKEYNLELLSEMRMGDFYDCIRKFEKYPTKKSNTGIK
jgi:hypothetical protein